MQKKTIVVVATGPGIGNHVAKEFGKNGFRVVLLARNKNKLEDYVSEFNRLDIECHYWVADCSNPLSLTHAFDEIKRLFTIDVLMYNGAVLTPKTIYNLSSEDLMKCYQVDVASALHCVLQVISQPVDSILFTGGGLALNPSYEYTTISIGKSALRTLAITLHQQLKEQNIYVGIVNIMGTMAKNTDYDPEIVSKIYYDMYMKKDRIETNY